jgi:hypothetical protein
VGPHKAGANQDSRNEEEDDEGRLRNDVDGRVLFFSVLPAEIKEGRRELLDHKQKVVGCAAPVLGRGFNNKRRTPFRLLFKFDRRMSGTRLEAQSVEEISRDFGWPSCHLSLGFQPKSFFGMAILPSFFGISGV